MDCHSKKEEHIHKVGRKFWMLSYALPLNLRQITGDWFFCYELVINHSDMNSNLNVIVPWLLAFQPFFLMLFCSGSKWRYLHFLFYLFLNKTDLLNITAFRKLKLWKKPDLRLLLPNLNYLHADFHRLLLYVFHSPASISLSWSWDYAAFL